jgi:hypothetical protein
VGHCFTHPWRVLTSALINFDTSGTALKDSDDQILLAEMETPRKDTPTASLSLLTSAFLFIAGVGLAG